MKAVKMKYCQILMVFFNFVFFVGGCALLGIGLWGFVAKDSFSKIISDNPAITNTVVIMMFVGAILIIEGFLGCTGAIRQSRCLLSMFGVLTFLLFAGEIAAIVLLNIYTPEAQQWILENMPQYNTSELIKSVWDSVQSMFQCCGLSNPEDWQGIIPNGTYPHSCCKSIPDTVNACRQSNPSFNWSGCESSVTGNTSLMNIILAATVIIAIEIGGLIFSCCLCYNISNKQYESY